MVSVIKPTNSQHKTPEINDDVSNKSLTITENDDNGDNDGDVRDKKDEDDPNHDGDENDVSNESKKCPESDDDDSDDDDLDSQSTATKSPGYVPHPSQSTNSSGRRKYSESEIEAVMKYMKVNK